MTEIDRRKVLGAAGAASLAAALPIAPAAAAELKLGPAKPFSFDALKAEAAALAKVAYKPPAQPSRWELMREEIALCGADGFLSRMVCELEVRTRYCSGWWGSAAECPSGRTADYGN